MKFLELLIVLFGIYILFTGMWLGWWIQYSAETVTILLMGLGVLIAGAGMILLVCRK